MELRHLRYFTAVAQELSFRRAAEKLNLAHATGADRPGLGRSGTRNSFRSNVPIPEEFASARHPHGFNVPAD